MTLGQAQLDHPIFVPNLFSRAENDVYLSLCAVSNHIRRYKRPEYIAHRDFAPIRALPDDCLLRDDVAVALPRDAERGMRSAR